MVDISSKLDETLSLIHQGEYFTINRPRQYGKTTTLFEIVKILQKHPGYLVVPTTFEDLGTKVFQNETHFCLTFAELLEEFIALNHPDLSLFLKSELPNIQSFKKLARLIRSLTQKSEKKIVLLIDEVDKACNFKIFLDFLGMLRSNYLIRDYFPTFHSVILIGIHNVKLLKQKIHPKAERSLNSPWNIAADFMVRMSFSSDEIASMLREYSEAENISMNIPLISETLYYHTSGYPFLVSRLCQIIAERILPKTGEKHWDLKHINAAVQYSLKHNDTNFDSLINNLEHHQALYKLVHRIIIEGESVAFNKDDTIIYLGLTYGIFSHNGTVKIHNRIYEQRIYNYMVTKTVVRSESGHNYGGHFRLPNNQLDMEAVLQKFQSFMKEEFSKKDSSFLERNGRLVFLAFLSPIINGGGYTFKEVQISLEKRLDVVVTYFQHRYIIELKRWYGEKAHTQGIAQLVDYLNIHKVDTGFLLIFEHKQAKSWRMEWIEAENKRIFAVWV